MRILVLLIMAGCGAADEKPPQICRPAMGPPVFTEVTSDWGVTAVATAVRSGDLDGDGYPDLVANIATDATRGTMTRFVLLNDKGNGFRDVTAESGLLATSDGAGGRSIGVANLGDMDNDGDLDIVTCPSAATAPDACAVFLNDGHAHFTQQTNDVLDKIGPFQCDSMALLDFDHDGNLDWWPGTFATHPWLFQGHGDGSVDEMGWMFGLPQIDGNDSDSTSWRQTFGVTACDLDGDGDDDVMLAGYGRQLNQVWRWDGDHFTEVGQMLGLAADDRMDYSDDISYQCYCQMTPGACPATVAKPPSGICPDRGWLTPDDEQPWRLGGNNFSLGCGDVDDDGDMDVMTATIRHWDVGSASDPSELCINQGDHFTRPGNENDGLLRMEKGDWNEGDMMPVFADVDLDGHKDIYLSSSDYPGDHAWLWRNKGDGTFEDVTSAWGAGQPQVHGVSLVDLDLDGDLDLVTGTSTARGVATSSAMRVYRNDMNGGNFIRLTLVGKTANRSAIGARVRVTTGNHVQTQEVSGGYGHVSIENDLALTFGLGDACEIDKIEVRWPDADNHVDTFTAVRGNYRVELTQGGGIRYLH